MKKEDIIKEQAARQAPVPPPEYIREMVAEASPDKKKIDPGDDVDKMMLDFATSDAWLMLKNYMEKKLILMAQRVREASDGAHTLDEVGFRYLASDQVNLFVQGIINYVEGPLRVRKAKDALESGKKNS